MQDVLAAPTTSAQLYQRDETQLEARGDMVDLANTGIEEIPKIIDNVVPSGAGSSHLDPPASSDALGDTAPVDEHMIAESTRRHEEPRPLRQVLASGLSVGSPQRAPHQMRWLEHEVWEAEGQKLTNDMTLASDEWNRAHKTLSIERNHREDTGEDLEYHHDFRIARIKKGNKRPLQLSAIARKRRAVKRQRDLDDEHELEKVHAEALLAEQAAKEKFDVADRDWKVADAQWKKHKVQHRAWLRASGDAVRASDFPLSAGTPMRPHYHRPQSTGDEETEVKADR